MTAWSKSYEVRTVGLMSIGFGLVSLDRFIIYPLFPVIAEDLNLTYQDLGLISGVLALTWGLSSIFSGNLSDRIGRKRVLISSVLLFSALVALTGLAAGLISLMIIRAIMGLAEGAFVPASIVTTIDASKPNRIGLNMGLQQMPAPLIGLGLGPLIAIGLLNILPSWEWVFGIVALPGFVLAYFLLRMIKEPPAPSAAPGPSTERTVLASFAAPLKHRNIVFAIFGMICFLSCLIVLATFMPSYLTDHAKLPLDQMGIVLSVSGVGGFLGLLIVPTMSDRYGRKRVLVIGMVIAVFALLVVVISVSVNPFVLASCLFAVSFVNSGVLAITAGPLVSETVPPAIAATATGFVVGVGEIFGGAAAPALTGMAAQTHGIEIVPKIALATATIGLLVVAYGIKEPPAKTNGKGQPVSV